MTEYEIMVNRGNVPLYYNAPSTTPTKIFNASTLDQGLSFDAITFHGAGPVEVRSIMSATARS